MFKFIDSCLSVYSASIQTGISVNNPTENQDL